MNENKEISIEAIFREGKLYAKIAELSQVVVQLAQEIEKLKTKEQ